MKYKIDFDKCGNENPFVVPDNYFETFVKRMEVLTMPKKVGIFQRTKSYWYAVAAVALVITTGVLFLNDYNKSKQIEAQQIAASEYKKVINKIVAEETNEEMIVDYILATAD